MNGLLKTPAGWALLGVGAVGLYLALRGPKGVATDLYEVASEAAQVATAEIVEQAKSLGGDIRAAVLAPQAQEFLLSIKVLGGVIPMNVVEEGIALGYMPRLQLLDGLPIFSQWSAAKAWMAARAIREYRQQVGAHY